MSPNTEEHEDGPGEGESPEPQWEAPKPRRGRRAIHRSTTTNRVPQKAAPASRKMQPSVVDHENIKDPEMKLALLCMQKKILLEGLISAATVSSDLHNDLFIEAEDRESKIMLAAHRLGDFHTVVGVMRRWCKVLQTKTNGPYEQREWCKKHGFNYYFFGNVERKVQALYSRMQAYVSPAEIPALNFQAQKDKSDELLRDALCEVYGPKVLVFRGHEHLGYCHALSQEKSPLHQSSVLNIFWKYPASILPVYNQYYVVLSDSKAEELVKGHTDKSLEDIRREIVLEKYNVPIVGRKIRENILEHIMNGSDAANCFYMELNEIVNPRENVIIEKDNTWFGLDLYCLPSHEKIVKEALKNFIEKERVKLNEEVKEIPYPVDSNQVRLVMSKGMGIDIVLYGGEHAKLGLGDCEPSKVDTIKTFEHVKSVEPSGVDTFSAIVTLSDPKHASEVITKVKALGDVEIHPVREVLPVVEPAIVEVTCAVDIHMTWLVHTNKYKKAQVKDEDIAMVKMGLLRLLSYIDEDKLEVRVERDPEDKKNVHCYMKCQDHHSTNRVLQCIGDAKNNGLPLEVLNEKGISEDLNKLFFKIHSGVYDALSSVICAKLKNCEEMADSSNWSMRWYVSNYGTGCHAIEVYFKRASQHNINYVHDKLLQCLKPLTVVRRSRHNTRALCAPTGQRLVKMLMQDTNAYIHIADFKNRVDVYGSKKAAQEVSKRLDQYFHATPYFEWEELEKLPHYPHDLNCVILHDTSKWVKGENKEVRVIGKNIYYTRTEDFDLDSLVTKKYQEAAKVTEEKEEAAVECGSCYVKFTPWMDGSVPADFIPYVTECCGHVYCSECLAEQFRSSKRYSLQCATCDLPFSLQDFLNTQHLHHGPYSLSQLLAAAAQKFVEKNYESYGCCSKPDCKGMFRKETKEQKSTMCCCCSVEYCPLCFAQRHGKMTCEEYLMSQHGVEVWMSENQAMRKRCPKCKMGIEKTGGCNHVHCAFCQISMCWLCLKTFTNSSPCYDHMELVHGGIYTNA